MWDIVYDALVFSAIVFVIAGILHLITLVVAHLLYSRKRKFGWLSMFLSPITGVLYIMVIVKISHSTYRYEDVFFFVFIFITLLLHSLIIVSLFMLVMLIKNKISKRKKCSSSQNYGK